MKSEPLCTLLLHNLVAVKKLLPCQTVLCLLRLSYDSVSFLQRTRVVPEADKLGNSGALLQERDVGDIVQVDDSSQLVCFFVLGSRSVVGGEHDILSLQAHLLGKDKLRQRRAVGTQSLFLQNLHYVWVRQSLHRKVILEAPRHP